MKAIGKLAAFGSATVGTAAVASFAWFAVHSTRSPEKRAAEKASTNIVCVGRDSVLRFLISGAHCPEEQTQVALSIAELHDFTDGDPWGTKPSVRPEGDSDRLASFQDRLSKLEQAPLFEVVDKDDSVVFRVSRGRVRMYNHTDIAVAGIEATADGGFFAGRTVDGALTSFVGASAARAGVRIIEAGVPRMDLGKQQAGNYSLVIPSNIAGNIAGIGESRAGSGALVVGDQAGNHRALMSSDGKGTLSIFNRTGITVLLLTEGDAKGGSLVINAASGEPMVKMNTNGRYGAVLTGPVAGFPLIQGSGLPGSYVLGCAGGEACRP